MQMPPGSANASSRDAQEGRDFVFPNGEGSLSAHHIISSDQVIVVQAAAN
jgi:hypothetical protein